MLPPAGLALALSPDPPASPAQSALAESKGHVVVRLAPGSLSPECPRSEGVTCQEKGREGGAKCKNLVLRQTRVGGAQPCPRTGLGTSGRAQCCSREPPAPPGNLGAGIRRAALWFVFLPWGWKGLQAFPRIIAFLFKIKTNFSLVHQQ